MAVYENYKYRLLFPSIFLCSILIFGPWVFAIVYSFNTSRRYGELTFSGLANYIRLLGDTRFSRSIQNVLLITLFGVALELVVGFGLALVANAKMRFMRVYRAILLVPLVLPGVAVAMMFQLMLAPNGLINYSLGVLLSVPRVNWVGDIRVAIFTVVLCEFWLNMPFMFASLLAGLQVLPKPLFEAAAMDGASRLQAFKNLTLPLMSPVILSALIIRMVWGFNIFAIVYVLTGGGPGLATETPAFYIYNTAMRYWDMGYASTIAICLTLIVMVLIVSFSRVTKWIVS